MQYLAEVRKQSKGFIGGSKTELKLLAYQRNDHSWTAVPGEQVISCEEANNFGDGALVMVNLEGNKQIQGTPQPAGTRVVSLLQNFTRLLEKSKNQEEEIDQWKQSLTYQSQELSRRQMEMEGRLEQLEQVEQEFERLDQQRQEVETLKQEFESKRQELDGAWQHLRGEQRRLEEQLGQSRGLDEQQAASIFALVERLKSAIAPTTTLQEQLDQAFAVVNSQQTKMDHHWQQREQQRTNAQQQQATVDQQAQELENHKQQLKEIQVSLELEQNQLHIQQNSMSVKQESARRLRLQMHQQAELYKSLSRLAISSGSIKFSQKIDLEALESMPLGELQAIVVKLQQDWEKMVRFVNDQEEELTLEQESVKEFQDKVGAASVYDRLGFEQELAEVQDRYRMLDETLVGQRRTLLEREEILKQHLRILQRRQGIAAPDGEHEKIDLGPVLSEVEVQQQQQEEELQKLKTQIEQIQRSVEQLQEKVKAQTQTQQTKENELLSLESNWQKAQLLVTQIWSRVNLYEESLQPLQDDLDQMRQLLEREAAVVHQAQETGNYQLQAIADLQETISSL